MDILELGQWLAGLGAPSKHLPRLGDLIARGWAGLGTFELALRAEGAESVDDLLAAQLTDHQLGSAASLRPPPWRPSVSSPSPFDGLAAEVEARAGALGLKLVHRAKLENGLRALRPGLSRFRVSGRRALP
jgi:hypothetical protein